jgi:integrase
LLATAVKGAFSKGEILSDAKPGFSMTTICAVIDAYVAVSPRLDQSALGRLSFWANQLGHIPIRDVTPDDVDGAIMRLAERGKLQTGPSSAGVHSGKPLAPATITRYLTSLGSVYKFARKQRLVSRTHVSPVAGLEKPNSPIDRNKFCSREQVDTLIKVARIVDKRWKKMPALITLAFHTGLRVGSLMNVRWKDIDWVESTVYIPRTKNGEPLASPLTRACLNELMAIKRGSAEERVFGNRKGEPFTYRKLFDEIAGLAGLPNVTFHWLRHSCGTAMARAGVNQASIMAVMGHKTLTASARYMHSNVSDRRRILNEVFS